MIGNNAIVNDRLVIGGDRVHLSNITVPFLTVLANRDHIVPEASAAPLIDLVGSADKQELRLDGGHVGLWSGGPQRRPPSPRSSTSCSKAQRGARGRRLAGRYRVPGQERWSEMTNLVSILTESASRRGDRPAIRLDDVVLSYAELDDPVRAPRAGCALAASSPATVSASCCPTSCSSRSSTTPCCAPVRSSSR